MKNKQIEGYFTKCIDGTEVRVGSILKVDGQEKKVKNIMYINMLVDRFDFEDGSFIFTGDEWEFLR
jgi:hypothetical protein